MKDERTGGRARAKNADKAEMKSNQGETGVSGISKGCKNVRVVISNHGPTVMLKRWTGSVNTETLKDKENTVPADVSSE